MNLIPKMVMPSEKRPQIWRGGIIQIMVTRSCDLACHGCSQGSNLAGKPALMTPDQFEQAVLSLEHYWGVVGTFGGNPCTSPYFADYCQILRKHVPFLQRGLWSNALRGKGADARITYNPKVSNLNTHMSQEAYDEFAAAWPESKPYLKGLEIDSIHGAPFVAIKDVIQDEQEQWNMIAQCDVNKNWSACVGLIPGQGLRAYFCELAYAQAALHADDPDWPVSGLECVPGWWKKPQSDFEAQIRQHCTACGIPMRRAGQQAINGTHEEFSETHRHIARPKVRDRVVEFVSVEALSRTDRPATEYLKGTTPGYKG